MKISWGWCSILVRSWREWVNPIPLAAVALILLFGWLMIFGDEGLLTLQRLRQTERESLQREQELTHRMERLHTEVDRLKDPAYLERIVRQEFGYVKPGETVYQFPDTEPAEQAPATREESHEQRAQRH